MIAAPSVSMSGLTLADLRRLVRPLHPGPKAQRLVFGTDLPWTRWEDDVCFVHSLTHYEAGLEYRVTAAGCPCPAGRGMCWHREARSISSVRPALEDGVWRVTEERAEHGQVVSYRRMVRLYRNRDGSYMRSCNCSKAVLGTGLCTDVELVNRIAGAMPSPGEVCITDLTEAMDQKYASLFRRPLGLAA